jgi:hypothetical protein
MTGVDAGTAAARGEKLLPTAATAATHGQQITLPGQRSRLFKPFVYLILQLATLIGYRVHLGGFGSSAGLEALLLGVSHEILLVAHFGL